MTNNNSTVEQVAMKPIIFSTPMVRAILEGRKTQTRRIIKDSFNGCLTNGGPHPCPNEPVVMYPGQRIEHPEKGEPDIVIEGDKVHAAFFCSTMDKIAYCPYGKPGDILYVRETWVKACLSEDGEGPAEGEKWKYWYRADDEWTKHDWHNPNVEGPVDAPRWKPSIHMPKSAARIFLKITDISVERLQDISWDDAVAEGCSGYRPTQDEPTHQFKRLWEEINGEDSWEQNPWIWKITFERIEKPEKYLQHIETLKQKEDGK